MRVLISSLAILASAFSVEAMTKYPLHSVAQAVNQLNTTWTAGLNQRWMGKDMAYIKHQMGTILPTPQHLRLPTMIHEVNEGAVPASFDARDNWPECPSIKEVRDQSNCGSCWAFGAVEAATDRICIATKGVNQTHLSAQHLLSCCSSCGFGCDGGYPASAWSYLKSTGLVSGGNYNDFSLCQSYSFAICDHHVVGKYPECGGSEYPTPKCASSCDSKSTYNVPFANDKHKFATSYSVSSAVSQIQTEIMTNGPVEGAFTVYDDFPTYKSGVYVKTSNTALGGHAIRILGWGTENNVAYWLVANSWNEDWGDNGFFKIRRGTNECGIEDEIVAGLFKA